MPSQTQLRDADATSAFSEEVKLIPRWSVVLAVLAFVFMQYLLWVFIPAGQHHRGYRDPVGIRLYYTTSWSVMASLYFLMVGYVSRDAPRRGMHTIFWTVIALIPGGVGAVLYFLLRQPVMTVCPSCGITIQREFHFCPQCAFQVSAVCGKCYRGVRVTDLYCGYCGHDLISDDAPARLRAL
ncbi:MAG TPA: zinc ribbon domain-containing protein [Acidobacteriaceae bacterium]|jgi:hypothetical protein|nr:zinc ribbon domain-containing protein [Acidobacteriaceae bacterium]